MYGPKDMMKRLCLEACTIHTHHVIFVTHRLVFLSYVRLGDWTLFGSDVCVSDSVFHFGVKCARCSVCYSVCI